MVRFPVFHEKKTVRKDIMCVLFSWYGTISLKPVTFLNIRGLLR